MTFKWNGVGASIYIVRGMYNVSGSWVKAACSSSLGGVTLVGSAGNLAWAWLERELSGRDFQILFYFRAILMILE